MANIYNTPLPGNNANSTASGAPTNLDFPPTPTPITPAPAPANIYNTPLPGNNANSTASGAPAPAKTAVAPHPDTPVVPPAPPAVANNKVSLPDGSVGTVNSTGGLVTDENTTDVTTPAQAAYEAAQKQTAADAAATSLGTQTNTTTNAPFISTSDSIQAWEKGIGDTLAKLTSDNAAQALASQNYIAQLQSESDALEARRADEIKNINDSFDSEKASEQDTQAHETGALTVTTQRAGGYLGAGASQTGALISLNNQHVLQLQSLEAKRQAAIQAASDAIDDKQFALAEAKSKEAKDYLTAQHDATQQYLEDQIAVHKAGQDEVTFQQNQAETQLKSLATLTPEDFANIDPATLKNIDQAYGVPGFAKSYVDVTYAASVAKSQTDALDAQTKLLNLLQNIPEGKNVTFPDPSDPSGPGTTYTGMGKTADLQTFMETDNYGNNTLITYNKATNTITRKAAGGGGKTSAAVDAASVKGAALSNIGEFIADPKNAILVPGDPTNPNSPGYMTADNYVAMYQKFITQYPGRGADFVDQYPIEFSVLPSQRTSTELNAFKQSDSSRSAAAK